MLIALLIVTLLSLATSLLCLSAVGTLITKTDAIARSQAMLTIDAANGIADKITDRLDNLENELEWKYQYWNLSNSLICEKLNIDLNDPEIGKSVNQYADNLFALTDSLTGFKGSYWDTATDEEAEAHLAEVSKN